MNGEAASANQRLGVARNDALQGATLAFQHSRDPSPNVNARSSATAAMASDHRPLGRQRTGSDAPEVGSVKDKIGRLGRPLSPPASTLLSVRGRSSAAALSSASQIAARLAASRSPARDTNAPSTTARLGAGAVRSASRVPPSPAEKRQLPAPTPLRSIQGSHRPLDRMLHENGLKSDSHLPIYGHSPPQESGTSLDYQDSREPSPHPSLESRNSFIPTDEPKPKLPPRVPPSRGSMRNDGGVAVRRPSTPSEVSISSQSHTTSTSSVIDDSIGMSEESLSNAIIASSLASARASPSIRAPPPLPPQRRGARSILHLAHQSKSDPSRTPSPPKSMPMTLRGIPKPTDADHRKHRNPLHKHPHKHKEGDRKRWRREITEKERKRYEGVWASNKGLLIPPDPSGTGPWPPNASDMVLNLVVREIWSRSRLPETILEQVWDLVDHQNIGLLVREEFVVGMWLIDQFLKGHKLPVNVRDSVWDSVRYVAGIKLPLEKGKAHA
ncbi:EPS15 homology (EH) [Penicillium italicum]|uniref:EPS15 homology (EH) n=1 Tax=Penicillium italicum TaxID=40296 RepID=A0A0A2L2T8_PENIT|nr:EPS15 homology (EH) [Penicillium italicum]